MSTASTKASTVPYRINSSEEKMLVVSFKLPNDNTIYHHTGAIWRAERCFRDILENILMNDFNYVGSLVILPTGRIWSPLKKEIHSGFYLA